MTAVEELDPLYHFSTHYPDRFSVLDPVYPAKNLDTKTTRQSRLARRKNNPRYKTQPITFDEIKEVEEPPTPVEEKDNNNSDHSSFLSKFQEHGGKVDNRLHPHKFEMRQDFIGRADSTSIDGFYDSPYPSKLSFLDEHHPLVHHRPTGSLRQSGRTAGAKLDKTSLKSKAARRRNNPRYKTQPITFDEIKEVEEPENGNNNDSNSDSMDLICNRKANTELPAVQCAIVH